MSRLFSEAKGDASSQKTVLYVLIDATLFFSLLEPKDKLLTVKYAINFTLLEKILKPLANALKPYEKSTEIVILFSMTQQDIDDEIFLVQIGDGWLNETRFSSLQNHHDLNALSSFKCKINKDHCVAFQPFNFDTVKLKTQCPTLSPKRVLVISSEPEFSKQAEEAGCHSILFHKPGFIKPEDYDQLSGYLEKEYQHREVKLDLDNTTIAREGSILVEEQLLSPTLITHLPKLPQAESTVFSVLTARNHPGHDDIDTFMESEILEWRALIGNLLDSGEAVQQKLGGMISAVENSFPGCKNAFKEPLDALTAAKKLLQDLGKTIKGIIEGFEFYRQAIRKFHGLFSAEISTLLTQIENYIASQPVEERALLREKKRQLVAVAASFDEIKSQFVKSNNELNKKYLCLIVSAEAIAMKFEEKTNLPLLIKRNSYTEYNKTRKTKVSAMVEEASQFIMPYFTIIRSSIGAANTEKDAAAIDLIMQYAAINVFMALIDDNEDEYNAAHKRAIAFSKQENSPITIFPIRVYREFDLQTDENEIPHIIHAFLEAVNPAPARAAAASPIDENRENEAPPNIIEDPPHGVLFSKRLGQQQ